MRKRGTLYTANKWNQPLFAQTIDNQDKNLHAFGDFLKKTWDDYAYESYKDAFGTKGHTTEDYKSSKNWLGLTKELNPLSKGNLGSTLKSGVLGAAGTIVGQAAYKGLSGGLNSGAGKAVNTIGSTAGNLVGMIPGVGQIVGPAVTALSGVIGGGINALVGTKTDEKKKAANDAGTNYLRNFNSTATDFSGVTGPMAVANVQNAHKGGWFKKDWAKIKNLKDINDRVAGENRANLATLNNITNISRNQLDDALVRYNTSFNTFDDGGPLDSTIIKNNNMGAIDYGFMSDYLAAKKQSADAKNKITSTNYGSIGAPNLFVLGGEEEYGVTLPEIEVTPSSPGNFNSVNYLSEAAAERDRQKNIAKSYFSQAPTVSNLYNGAAAFAKSLPFVGVGPEDMMGKYNQTNSGVINPAFMPELDALDFATLQATFKKIKGIERAAAEFRMNPKLREAGKQWQAKSKQWEGHVKPEKPLPSPNADMYREQQQKGLMTRYKKFLSEKAEKGGFKTIADLLKFYDLGGDLQSHGGDWSTGLSQINAGGSHEENPNEGVQVGVDQEGTPDLVEQGETIYNDYVYSKRIMMDDEAKEHFHISKKREISYADYSKILEKEAAERPNDPISKNALDKQMQELADEQERQKAEMQAEQAKEAFNSLPPEEQVAIMQQAAAQEAAAQQAPEEQMPMQEGQPMQPMEQAAMQPMEEQQMMEQPAIEQQPVEPPIMSAYGGKVNKFVQGGIKDAITADYLRRLAVEAPLLDSNNAYIPSSDYPLTFDFQHGGWGKEDYNAWMNSTDASWREAVEKGLVKEGMSAKEIADALSKTESYRRGTDWLKADPNNMLRYLQHILASPDAPQKAKDYARKFVDEKGWLNGITPNYDTVFGTVRSTHPGTYWKTPEEALRGENIGNLLVSPDGTITEIVGDIPENLQLINSYSWDSPRAFNRYSYYAAPETSTGLSLNESGEYYIPGVPTAPVDTDEKIPTVKTDNKTVVPKLKKEWPRQFGLLGPAVALAMQAAKVGKSSYKGLEAAAELAGTPAVLGIPKYVGNFQAPEKRDKWAEFTRTSADNMAANRAIMNSAAPVSTKIAGIVANNYGTQVAQGENALKDIDRRNATKLQYANYNTGLEEFNANMLNKTTLANADMINRNKQFKAQVDLEAANQKLANDAAWYSSIYGNIDSLFKGISGYGDENARHNMIARMAADGLFKTMTPEQFISKGYLKYGEDSKAAKGGKINRKKKRGLTF